MFKDPYNYLKYEKLQEENFQLKERLLQIKEWAGRLPSNPRYSSIHTAIIHRIASEIILLCNKEL